MPFKLANAPAILQHMINNILWDPIDHGVVVSINDIPIYTEITQKHVE
jgi:hypothetical protein